MGNLIDADNELQYATLETIDEGDKGSTITARNGQDPRQFFPLLESLRGLAALAVAIFHANQTTWLQEGTTHPIRFCLESDAACLIGKIWWHINGLSAVLLFFVISGYVLTVSMKRRSKAWTDAPRYAASRALRLYPAVILMVALFALFQFSAGYQMYDGSFSIIDVINQSLLLNSKINGVTYTLQLELIGSAILFVAFHADRRFGGWAAFILFLIFTALSFLPSFARLLIPYGGPPLIFFSAFMAGMLSARISPRLSELSTTTQRVVLFSAVLLFAITRPFIAASSGWTVLLESVSAGLVVGILAQGRTGALLALAPLKSLGRISYSFYLLHPLAWYFFIAHIDWFRTNIPGPDIMVSIVGLLFIVAVTIPLAVFSYVTVERPMLHFGRNR